MPAKTAPRKPAPAKPDARADDDRITFWGIVCASFYAAMLGKRDSSLVFTPLSGMKLDMPKFLARKDVQARMQQLRDLNLTRT